MQRITKNKADKAAWPGSQALFDSLRKGLVQLEQQSKHLKEACEAVKNVHTVIDQVAFGGACGNIMVHWTQTLKVHQSIFQEVVNITKPPPGTDADALNDGFSVLLAAVVEADKTVGHVVRCIKQSIDDKDSSNNRSATSDEEDEVTKSPVRKALEAEMTPSKKRKIELGGEMHALPLHPPAQDQDKDEEQHTKSNTKAFDQKASDAHDSRKIRKAHGKKNKINGDEHVMGGALPTPNINKLANEMAPPAVPAEKKRKDSFEDITGEVDAALKAKEEKRRLKKESKKRKRNSIGSSVIDHSDVGDDTKAGSAAPMQEVTRKPTTWEDKPLKKKAKLEIAAKMTASIPKAPHKGSKKSKKNTSADPNSEKPSFMAGATPVTNNLSQNANGPGGNKHGKADGKSGKKSKRRHSSADADEAPQTTVAHEQTGKKVKKARTS